MSRVGPAQMKKLLDLLTEDGVLHHGRVMYMNTNKQNFWKHIATKLNSVDGGVYKNTWKWCKMWADWKNKTKKKAIALLRGKNINSECPPPALTKLELRLLKLIEYPSYDMQQLQMTVDKIEPPESIDKQDYLNIDFDNTTDNAKEEKICQIEYVNTAESKFNTDNASNDDLYEKPEDSSDFERKVKAKGKLHKKKKISFQEYKVRTTLALEKERCHQKTEELRLKALELKLLGEKLRLEELEMNKINYLTNIEEEKLKYIRDISASLKELV